MDAPINKSGQTQEGVNYRVLILWRLELLDKKQMVEKYREVEPDEVLDGLADEESYTPVPLKLV